MARFVKNIDDSLGKSPNDLVFIGKRKVEETTISVIDYDRDYLDEKKFKSIEECTVYKDTDKVSWININGLQDIETIRKAGQCFDLHPLVLGNILNTGHRPKIEEYDDYIFFIVKMMRYDEDKGLIKSEQLSIILGKNYIVTFQEKPGDVFDPVRDRIRKNKGRIRKIGIDYLAYALLDIIVENYIKIIERLGEQIEEVEDEILDNPDQDALVQINNYKREMNYLRKAIRPARDSILHLSRLDSDLIDDDTIPFLNDLLHIANQAVEGIDSYREMLSDHLNIYNTGVNKRLNEIMKVLTMFSAVFIPLTFIAGVYGTNFVNVPELKMTYGYFIMWGVFVVVFFAMLRFFKKKNWL